MSKEIEMYQGRGMHNRAAKFNYYFDKITCLFSKEKDTSVIKDPKNILIIRNDHVGDMVYSTHIFRELKKKFPKLKITVLATKGNKQIIEKDKNVDDIILGGLFWRDKSFSSFFNYLKTLKEIKKRKFDVALDLRSSKLNMFFFMYLANIKKRAAFYNINGGKAFLTHAYLYEGKIHFIDEMTLLVSKAFGIPRKRYWPYIAVTKEDEKIAKDFLKKNGIKKYIVLFPATTDDRKRWPEEKFSELINKFHRKYPNYKIIVSSSKSDEELVKRLCEGRKNFCVPELELNLRIMCFILKKSDAVVACNGAGTDVSWVIGANLVALTDGVVDLGVNMPLKKSKVIIPPMKSFPSDWAIKDISVEEVMEKIEEFIKERKNFINLHKIKY